MDDNFNIKVKINLDSSEDEVERDIIDLVCRVKTLWEPKLVTIQRLTGGFIHCIWVCIHTPTPEEKVVMRLNYDTDKNPISDQQYEFLVLKELSANGLVQPLLGR